MCFDGDLLSPVPAISGAAVSHDDLVVEARDGKLLSAARFEGASRSFFGRKAHEFAEGSEDSGRRVLAFVERHA